MAMDTIGKHIMENGRHHSFWKWKGLSVGDDANDEWDDHIHGSRASFRLRPMEGNVGLQRMFENMNAIPLTFVPLASEAHGVVRVEQQNLINT